MRKKKSIRKSGRKKKGEKKKTLTQEKNKKLGLGKEREEVTKKLSQVRKSGEEPRKRCEKGETAKLYKKEKNSKKAE